jgi:hypothetical protein
MKKTTFLTLTACVTAMALTACASRTPRSASYGGDDFAPQAAEDSTSITFERDGVAGKSSTTFDYARHADYEKDLGSRLDTLSRDIDALHDAAAAGSDCERRMAYLQALRDSLKEKLGELPNITQDQYEAKYLDLEDRFTVIQRFLDQDRAACSANR